MLYFEFEIVLKFYNLEAWRPVYFPLATMALCMEWKSLNNHPRITPVLFGEIPQSSLGGDGHCWRMDELTQPVCKDLFPFLKLGPGAS